MAAGIPTNTRLTYGATGIREDLSNIIYNISPTDTPFISGAGRDSCDNTIFEWQIDALENAGINRVGEGWSPEADEKTEPTRVKNYTQISMKTVRSSMTAEAVDFAGRKSTQAYQLAKRSKELKRDMEKMLTDNVEFAVGAADGTPRATAGLGAWVGGNYHSVGTAGPSGNVGAACTGDGSNKTTDATLKGAITEAAMKTVIKKCYDNGGNPDTIMVGSTQKQVVSGLASATSIAPLQTAANKVAPAHMVASVSIYVSDFGNFKIIPNRFQRPGDMWFIDFDFWSVSYLRPFKTEALAKTGDSVVQMIVAEYGLKSKNQKASGLLADCA